MDVKALGLSLGYKFRLIIENWQNIGHKIPQRIYYLSIADIYDEIRLHDASMLHCDLDTYIILL